jgi:predicted O-linked N-acetylglucosamine transferase (SPINDLY family)
MRYTIADLFLDTLPCNAHTTAADALWSGLPVLTCKGSTFAGRVAASLLHAAGLDELVTPSLDVYEALALRLARDQSTLQQLKHRLRTQRSQSGLFDSTRLCRRLEAAFAEMHERGLRGDRPGHFAVPSLVGS